MASTRLYVVPGSHPSLSAQLALELKGIPFKRVDLISGLHVIPQRLRFGERTAPGIQFADGERVVGSLAIMRALERRVPEPPLFPPEASARARVEEAEGWGESVLQPIPRRLSYNGAQRVPAGAMLSYAEDSKLPLPIWTARPFVPLILRFERRLNRASDAAVRADLRDLNATLDVADRYLADGVLGGAVPNAADLQIAPTVRLLLTMDDLAPIVEAHPIAALARRLVPSFPGRLPRGALPAEWLPPVRIGTETD